MKAETVLIFPPHTDKPYKDLEDAASVLPPIGIAYIAGYLREKGIKVSVIDAYAERLTIEQTVKRVIDINPPIIGISITSAVVFIANEIAEKVKSINPNITIMVGGPHMSAVSQETMERMPNFDIGVFGEGEITCFEVVKNLQRNNYKIDYLDGVNGIIYRMNGTVKKNKPREYIKDLDILPFPAFDLLPELAKFYKLPGDNIKRLPAISLVTSRGCPRGCTFCDRSTFGRRLRAHSNNYILKLIKYLIGRYGIKDIAFYDDNLMANPPKLRKLCKLLMDEKLDLTWSCEGSVHYAKEEDLKLMKAAGCWQISWGLESGSQEILDVFNKGTTVEQNKEALFAAYKAGIDNRGFFMIGGFEETRQTIEKTLQFIEEMPIVNFHVTYFTVYPGSEAARDAHKFGTYDNDWRLLNSFTPNFQPFGITREELCTYFKKFYIVFYFRPKIIMYFFKKLVREPCIFKELFKSFISLTKFALKRSK